jgi:hypothetical protein
MSLYESNTSIGLVRRTPKKKTIRQRLAEWLTKDDHDVEEYDPHNIRNITPIEQLNVDPIRLSIYQASGGYIVETRMRNTSNHNHHTADHEYRLHIVSDRDGMDLGTELSKILTKDILRA